MESTTRGSDWRDERQRQGFRAGRDDRLLEVDVGHAAFGQLDLQLVRRGEPAVAPDGGDLALPGQPGQAAGEPPDHAVLPLPQLVQVDGGRTERDAVLAHLLGLGDDLGGVQQGLGRDAADVEADSAEGRPAVHEHDLLTQVGGSERGRVTARPGAEDEDVRRDGTGPGLMARRRARPAGGPGLCRGGPGLCRGGPGLCRDSLGPRRGCLGRRMLAGAQVSNDVAGGDVVADGDADGGDGPGHGRRDVQGGLVRFQGDQRVLGRDGVAGRDMHLDHRYFDEMADVGDRDLDDLVDPAGRAVAGRLGRRGGRVLGDPFPHWRGGRAAGCCRGVEPQDEISGGYRVADPDGDLADGPRHRRGNVQRRLVGLQRDDRIFGAHHIAGGHMHLDDRYIDEVADVGNGDIHVRLLRNRVRRDGPGGGQSRRARMSSSNWHRYRANRAASAPSMTRWS